MRTLSKLRIAFNDNMSYNYVVQIKKIKNGGNMEALEVLIFLLFWGGIIAGIIALIVRKKKKEKNRIKMEQFKAGLNKAFLSFDDQKWFNDLYDDILKARGISLSQLENACTLIPECKERFTLTCNELIALGKSNVCLLKEDASDEILNNMEYLEKQEKITKDIINVLPVLANFFREYDYFYKGINEGLFEETFFADSATWGVAYENKENYSTPEEIKNYEDRFSNLCNRMESFTNDISEDYIKFFLGLDRNADDIDLEKIPAAAPYLAYEKENHSKFVSQVLDMYVERLREAALPFIRVRADLYQYFKEINEKVSSTLPWFSIYYFSLPFSSPISSLKENTEDECLRVLELYKSGQMKGEYFSLSDPKYKIKT